MKKIFSSIVALVFLTVTSITTASAAENSYGKQKVVYHINYDNPKKQAGHYATFKTILMQLGPRILT